MRQGHNATVWKERRSMSDAPRMSRRQLREQGKLSVRPADGVDISETTELRLRRPSRKELREARKAETGMIPAVTEPVAEDEGVVQSQKSSQPERLSVFERFEEENALEPALDVAEDNPEAATGENPVPNEAVEQDSEQEPDSPGSQLSEEDDAHSEESHEEATQDSSSHEKSDVAESASVDSDGEDEGDENDEDEDDESPVAMRERLLSMTRRQSLEEPKQENTGDVSRTSVMPEGSDLEAEELGQLVAPDTLTPQDEDIFRRRKPNGFRR